MQPDELIALKQEAKRKKITNRELAEVVGLSESMISKVLNYHAFTSDYNYAKMKHYIKNKQAFVWMKMPVN
ncbi:MAG: helix-turn-helix domain-containing protein [Bacillaceae bacterium]|nr:helix-turn-helix domain-containing protein [Bacillaceae bacterium]